MQKLESRRLLVSLDSILDTQLANVAGLNEGHAIALLASGKYHDRVSNKFSRMVSEIDDELVTKVYALRDTTTLRLSGPTGIISEIHDTVVTSKTGDSGVMSRFEFVVVVNVWPYKLTDDEMEAHRDVIHASTTADKVEVVSVPMCDVTPEYISNFDIFIWHELNGWVTQHIDSLFDGAAKNVNCYFPLIAVKDEDTVESMPEGYLEFNVMTAWGDAMNLNLMPLERYSLIQRL